MTYTSHGLMTAADLEEYRQDYDWDELNQPEPQDDECVHGRLLTDDCDDCEQETTMTKTATYTIGRWWEMNGEPTAEGFAKVGIRIIDAPAEQT